MALVAVPSNRTVQRSIAIATTTATTLTKLKEIIITLAGDYRFRFVMGVTGGTVGDIQVQIFRNDVAAGILHTQAFNASDARVVEDVGLWEKGDLCQLFARMTNDGTAEVSAWSILGEFAERPPPIPPGRVNLD